MGEFLSYLKNFLRPGYHVKKIQEDFRASMHALKNRDLEVLKCNEKSLAKAIRGRLLATYFLVGPFGILGPIVGTYFQYWIATHLPFASLLTFAVTIIVGNIFSTLGFQIIWAWTARSLYRSPDPPYYHWVTFWSDILPLQLKGLKRWLGANSILMPMSVVALSLIDKFLPAIGHAVPIGVLTPAMELIFVHTALIRLMGDVFENESQRIAQHHALPTAA
ncbi:MAG: hypothetical protein JSS66_14260 [Armatimonadetes bacterium]|nr:hypothetical protein [Armatimonadota bacterium]